MGEIQATVSINKNSSFTSRIVLHNENNAIIKKIKVNEVTVSKIAISMLLSPV